MKLLRIGQVGGGADTSQDGDTDEEENGTLRHSLTEARIKILVARAHRLEAEARLLDDVGSYYKGLAARAEAEADIVIAEKDRKEEELSNPRVRKLLLAEMAWNTLKNIRRAQVDILRNRRTSPTTSPRPGRRTEGDRGRGRRKSGPGYQNRNRRSAVPAAPSDDVT